MIECWFCGKECYSFLHSCSGIPRTPAAWSRYQANPERYQRKLAAMRQGLKVLR